jgi:kynurenine formamidase
MTTRRAEEAGAWDHSEAVQYIELSHGIADGMPVVPGLERPRVTAFLDHEQSRPVYEGAAEFYISKVEMVGVDFWNVDDTSDPSRRVHTRLLAEEILIVEHLCNLDALPETGFRFFAVPLRIVTGASLPVRAFAEVPGG